ncbi:MAG: hypothetical protein H6709_05310 [Kofleriaceae bacterium]|nr:hypothetical protein [Myxococcales bacterium]MCB9559879.1 hypothetical protein [Kofleriaceae bacterium]MCB9571491.1 hypothetical protein [Kofleriaceae bacterium]
MAAAKHWTQRLQSFDRRWLFLAMGLAITLPLIFPINTPIKPSPMVQSAYYTVDALPDGDPADSSKGATVFISLDVDPASTPELEPYFRAVLLQLKAKNVKLVMATTWYSAPPLIERWIREMVEQPLAPAGTPGYDGPPDRAYKKNVDYVWLGFREGKQAVISAFGSDLRGTFDGRAADGTPLDQIPMMSGKKQLKDFDLMILVSAGFPGAKEYVQLVQSRYDLKMVAACTAVSTTDLTPYFQAGQLLGLVGGLAASAEYETMVGKKGLGTQAADVLNIGHLVVILAIIFGNIIFFAGRAHRRRQGL